MDVDVVVAEPLAESCDWLSTVAEFTCNGSDALTWSEDRSAAAPDTTCAWYHGNWQYLRLLGLVSNPANHTDFYLEALQAAAGDLSQADVAVCGAADYSMPAHVYTALGPEVRATVYELCRTPLLATDWYSLRYSLPKLRLVQGDARTCLPPDGFDVVVTDSFLPRIEQDGLVPMLQSWRTALRPGGAVITTVRIAAPGEDNREQFVDLFAETVRTSAAWLPTVTRRPIDELRERASAWVRRQERTVFEDPARIIELFEAAGFRKVDAARKSAAGKDYLEMVAVR
jgi:SAM-dependent methyltransferase